MSLDECPICRVFIWGRAHTCHPRWQVNRTAKYLGYKSDEECLDHARVVFAMDAEAAATQYLESEDVDDCEFTEEAEVLVREGVDNTDAPIQRFQVFGELVRSYSAREIVPKPPA